MANNQYRSGADFKSVVPFIEGQTPSYLKSQEDFVEFIKAYFKWLEEDGNALDRILSLTRIRDVDYGATEFLEKFRKEVAKTIPSFAAMDSKLLLKSITQFYRSKTTEDSIKHLFRMVFDNNVEITYDSQRLLQTENVLASTDIVIRLNYTSLVDPVALIGETIFQFPDVFALVVGASSNSYNGVDFVELTLINETSAFLHSQTVYHVTSTGNVALGSTYRIVSSATIASSGANYQVRDTIPLATLGDGFGLAAYVGEVSGYVGEVDILAGGEGYESTPTIVVSGNGIGAVLTPTVVNGEITAVVIDNPGTGYTAVSLSISGGNPDVPARLEAFLRGTLEEIFITDPGVNYSVAPTANMATLVHGGTGGAITFNLGGQAAKTSNSRFSNYPDGIPDQNYVWLYLLGFGVGNFVGGETIEQLNENNEITFSGTVNTWSATTKRLTLLKTQTGAFDPDKNFVGLTSLANWSYQSIYSRPIRLDAGDDEINREYRYKINSIVSIDQYRDVLKKNAHPAGMQFFGSVDLSELSPTILDVGIYPSGVNFDNPDEVSARSFFLMKVIIQTVLKEQFISYYDEDELDDIWDNGITIDENLITLIEGSALDPEEAGSPNIVAITYPTPVYESDVYVPEAVYSP